MKKEKTSKTPEVSFIKNLLLNKWFLAGIGGLLVFVLLSFIFLYNPKFVPVLLKSTTKTLGDKIVGKDLAAKIDETRDENGATSIRLLFNDNKEENLEKHCEKKEEQGKEQEKCLKTYKNTEFGYSVKYPSGWEKRADKTIFVDQNLINSEGEVNDIEVEVYDNKNNLGINDWLNANKDLFIGNQSMSEVVGFNNRQSISVNRVPAIQFTWNSMGEIRSTVLAYNLKVYVIDVSTLSSFALDPEMGKVGNDFINSFKLQ